MANKYHSDAKTPNIEVLNYVPIRQDTGDLEAATKTISATSEASGLANKDYSSAKTLAAPSDARLSVVSLITRLSVTIDSDDGTHDLRCRVYVDAQDADHLLFDLTYSTTGNQLAVQALTSSTKAIIFNLLKDGAAHTFYFYFWSPGNHSPVISLVNLWEAVGSNKSAAWGYPVLSFTSPIACEAQVRVYHSVLGTGTMTSTFLLNNAANANTGYFGLHETGLIEVASNIGMFIGMTWQMLPASFPVTLLIYGSVATDLQAIAAITVFIKRWD